MRRGMPAYRRDPVAAPVTGGADQSVAAFQPAGRPWLILTTLKLLKRALEKEDVRCTRRRSLASVDDPTLTTQGSELTVQVLVVPVSLGGGEQLPAPSVASTHPGVFPAIDEREVSPVVDAGVRSVAGAEQINQY